MAKIHISLEAQDRMIEGKSEEAVKREFQTAVGMLGIKILSVKFEKKEEIKSDE